MLNGLGMLFMELLTNRAQIFADVRTFWSPESTKRATGYDLTGKAKENGGIIHLLNSGAACLDACGECRDENGNAVMKKWWEVTDEDIDAACRSMNPQNPDAVKREMQENGRGFALRETAERLKAARFVASQAKITVADAPASPAADASKAE